jgi:hypothetical protein
VPVPRQSKWIRNNPVKLVNNCAIRPIGVYFILEISGALVSEGGGYAIAIRRADNEVAKRQQESERRDHGNR